MAKAIIRDGFQTRRRMLLLATLVLCGSTWFGLAIPAQSVGDDEIIQVIPPDSIPAVIKPQFRTANQATLKPDSPVIGYINGSAARAYSLRLLDRHEIVDDVVQDRPVAVTWCPLCRTAIVYDRVVNGQVLTFAVSGKLWHNALVMYDRETRSLWSQVTGQAIAGKLKGTRLRMLVATPSISWQAWKSRHSATLVLSVDGTEDYDFDPYADYEAAQNRSGLYRETRIDHRTAPKDIVLGVSLGNVSAAYRIADLRRLGFISDIVGGTPILAWFDRTTEATSVYYLPSNGAVHVARQTLTIDRRRWDLATGESSEGGPDLKPVPHTTAYWFAWSAFHPASKLFIPSPHPD